ncbi:MAG: hypothetical protein UX53_C0043G0005 [Candidatus Azambacteria bacterium GW2011_GWB2_46_37]|uniref:Uncharacterized protein n=1 Tax=Candidatus Azambacteria bacterium GW2011_GWB2_46_37 TaxID=1618618 RepID=A0A0G1PY56_9BACT|nr:MAG: hypothetical protein UX53_C0043G0005 [Candidatus Azambacteria bacterium GW2011_GWB2_46_37]HAM95624.1 hypothetical protein [Candidatus Azambacteria bacterium]HAQ05509.1 hypothetical protein [Candidatus Azambacteria bacterium]HBA52645.1 hypothetical protein [Candidatus Azambacteria bacterium]HBC59512.1 hypothetical protein [Candidatus Azambacteria bacterium]
MKFNFLLIILSLAGIFFIILRKIPVLLQINDDGPAHGGEGENFIRPSFPRVYSRLLKNFHGPRFVNFFLIILEKFLRKLKIAFLKIDNVITGWLVSVRMKSQSAHLESRYLSLWARRKNDLERNDKFDNLE